MDRVQFLNSISYKDESEKCSMVEVFWDQYMLLYNLVDSIEHCEKIAESPSSITFSLVYSNLEMINTIKSIISISPVLDMYESRFQISYFVPVDNTINIQIAKI